jgi:hypothetical protein
MESATHVEIDTKVGKIIQKIELALEKLEKSVFYGEFVKQIQTPKFVKMIQRVIGADPNHSQLQLVLYGVGVMEPNDQYRYVQPHRMQLCLAILLRKNFEWVHDVLVYDPALSPMEQKAINAFDCTCLAVNEYGRRTVDRPTLFFMPHCEHFLYENVVEANWTPANLNKIIILGNGFNLYDKGKKLFPYYRGARKIQAILQSDHMLYEMPLPTTGIDTECVNSLCWDGSPPPYTDRLRSIDPVYHDSFDSLSWHFFDWDGSLHSFNTGEYAQIDYTSEEVIKKIQISPKMLTDMHRPEINEMEEMVAELVNKIQNAGVKLENSSFYRHFMEQMKNPQIVNRIQKSDRHRSKIL